MDENAMTKPLLCGCIKKLEKIPSLCECIVILNNLLYTDKIGHLFFADTEFHFRNEKTMLFNEIYT